MAIEKIKILGALWELPAKQHCQSFPFTLKLGLIGQNWQCCLADSSKRAPKILIFFNCHRCRIFILCEIHCYFCPHILWIYYFCLSQCERTFSILCTSIFLSYRGVDCITIEEIYFSDFSCMFLNRSYHFLI